MATTVGYSRGNDRVKRDLDLGLAVVIDVMRAVVGRLVRMLVRMVSWWCNADGIFGTAASKIIVFTHLTAISRRVIIIARGWRFFWR